MVNTGAGGASLSTLIKAGRTPPVASLNGRWLSTRSIAQYYSQKMCKVELTSQHRRDLSGVSRDRNPYICRVTKNLIKHRLVSDILVATSALLVPLQTL